MVRTGTTRVRDKVPSQNFDQRSLSDVLLQTIEKNRKLLVGVAKYKNWCKKPQWIALASNVQESNRETNIMFEILIIFEKLLSLKLKWF